MAGFYHARADALELWSLKVTDPEMKRLDLLATALAADKVEMGKATTPSDQAVELAKAISAGTG